MKAMFPSTNRDFSKFSEIMKESNFQYFEMNKSAQETLGLCIVSSISNLDCAMELKSIGEFYSDVFRELERLKKTANIKL